MFSPSLSLPSVSFFPSSPHPPFRSGPLNPAMRPVDSNVARGLKGGTRKTGLTGDLYARVWEGGIRGPPFPQKKLNLGLAEVQFPLLLRAHLQSSVSSDSISSVFEILWSKHIGVTSLTLVNILSRSMQIWTNCETHIFKKWCNLQTPRGSASAFPGGPGAEPTAPAEIKFGAESDFLCKLITLLQVMVNIQIFNLQRKLTHSPSFCNPPP